ncbi:hypothetical protein PsYK624_165660 [Phanerochaete sordida]|uniref:Uncharacterized protein n=1 Tax=Phanerochaete sordida TaxID=48140 RepID=A0A9P3GSB6_9APHY|nr:hypothetical protein PsYK624_165660 [Phanerochaete sordida]
MACAFNFSTQAALFREGNPEMSAEDRTDIVRFHNNALRAGSATAKISQQHVGAARMTTHCVGIGSPVNFYRLGRQTVGAGVGDDHV